MLLGASGCGKSTLLNAVAGLLDINAGQVWIGGKNVTWEEPKDRGIGMVFQSYALYPRMTAEGNMSFGLKMARVPRDEIEQRVKRAAELLQIEPLLKRRPAELSGGQRQRVAIGRALVRDVDVFLFDEPLSNLDAKLRTELRVELKRLHQQLGKATMIYVTHDQIEALTLADRIAVMHAGVIQQLDTPHNIYHRPANRFVAGFVGSPTMNFRTGRVSGCRRPGLRVGRHPRSARGLSLAERLAAEGRGRARPAARAHRDRRRPCDRATTRRSSWSSRWARRRSSGAGSPASRSPSASRATARSAPARACRSAFPIERVNLFDAKTGVRL